MIARHLGQIVLVRGAIPGERVRAWIERAEKRMAYAVTREVVEASPDRRADGRSRGSRSAAARSTRTSPTRASSRSSPTLSATRSAGSGATRSIVRSTSPASPEEGYRMRARLHVHAGRAGFYREGTHQLCDAAVTRQLRAETVAAVGAARGQPRARRPGRGGLHHHFRKHRRRRAGRASRAGAGRPRLRRSARARGGRRAARRHQHAGRRRRASRARSAIPSVSDPLSALTAIASRDGTLRASCRVLLPGEPVPARRR